jgi:hypothetical protein
MDALGWPRFEDPGGRNCVAALYAVNTQQHLARQYVMRRRSHMHVHDLYERVKASIDAKEAEFKNAYASLIHHFGNSSFRALVHGATAEYQSSEAKFVALAEVWGEHNLGRSIVDYYHSAHLQIIGMGSEALPFLLDRVASGEPEWIFALKCITGEQPESEASNGDAASVIRDWVEWGKCRGLISR